MGSTPSQKSELRTQTKTNDSLPPTDEFNDRASDGLGDDEASSMKMHQAELKKDENIQNTYCDTPTPEPGSIRLLRLLPSKDKDGGIQCQLFTSRYPLQELGEGAPLYEALSYVWGDDNPDSRLPISVNGHGFSITANLHAALLHLRNRRIKRTIWVDAICINQGDEREKEKQIEHMAEIFSKASRVIVWLGDGKNDGDQALENIRLAAENMPAKPLVDEPSKQAIIALLQRPWFERIWVLQEVAAARSIIIKCGSTDIDGYAFCVALDSKLPDLLGEAASDLRGLIHTATYLIRGAVFRCKKVPRSPGRISLRIRPLSELIDMYHTHKATKRHDKVYALLGMSSDETIPEQLSVNYEISWEDLFQNLIKFSLFNRISPMDEKVSVAIWNDDKEVAVITCKGYGLGSVFSSERDHTRGDRQRVEITWKSNFDTRGKLSSSVFLLSTKSIKKGDVVCLLQGASKPTIVRPRNGYSTIIMIAAPLDDLDPAFRSITTFPNDILLVWDWVAQDERDYKGLITNQQRPRCQRLECKCQDLGEATRLWNLGLLLNGVGGYEDAIRTTRMALDVYREALRNTIHEPWKEENKELLRIIDVLDNGAAIEADYNDHGRTPLLWAAQYGYEAVMQYLVEKGADIEIKDNYGRTVLSWAAQYGYVAVVQSLVEKGADINTEDNYYRTPLSWAAQNGYKAVVQYLVKKGANIETKDNSKQTPLLWAARNGHEAVVRYLFERGADIEVEDNSKQTPLSWAARYGYKAIMQYLFEKGANINTEDNYYRTPLSWAARNGHEAVVQYLVKKGADIETKDSYSRTPLSWAAYNGYKAIVQYLFEKGADIEARDNFEQMPLSWAARNGYKAVVQYLVEKGADTETKDDSGQTPLFWAAQNGHEAVVQILEIYASTPTASAASTTPHNVLS